MRTLGIIRLKLRKTAQNVCAGRPQKARLRLPARQLLWAPPECRLLAAWTRRKCTEREVFMLRESMKTVQIVMFWASREAQNPHLLLLAPWERCAVYKGLETLIYGIPQLRHSRAPLRSRILFRWPFWPSE